MRSSAEAGSYVRLIDSFNTQLKAQEPSRTCDESKEKELLQRSAFGFVGESSGGEGLGVNYASTYPCRILSRTPVGTGGVLLRVQPLNLNHSPCLHGGVT
jgi:hypothetical protein